MFTPPVGSLLLIAVLIPVVTAATSKVDNLTLASTFGVVLPLAMMASLSLHPTVRASTLCIAAWLVASGAAALTIATLAKNAATQHLGDRLGLAFFGPTTSTGPVLAALAVMVLAILPTKRNARFFGMSVFVILVLGVAFTQSRGAAVALAAGLTVSLLLGAKAQRRAAFLGGAIAVALLLFAPRSLFTAAQATTFRGDSLSFHWHLFLQRPLLGYGVSKETLSAAAGAHNSLLAIANGIGGVGALLFLFTWLWPLSGASREWFAQGAAILTVLFVSWFLAGGEVLFQIPVTDMLPLVLACALSTRRGDSPRACGNRGVPTLARAQSG